MSAAKHAEGPWRANRRASYAEPGWVILWRDTSKPGTHHRRLDYQGNFTEADARLIAAAPELLEALRRTTEMCESYAEWIKRNAMSADIEQHPYLPELDGAAEDARAAIAKATGVSP